MNLPFSGPGLSLWIMIGVGTCMGLKRTFDPASRAAWVAANAFHRAAIYGLAFLFWPVLWAFLIFVSLGRPSGPQDDPGDDTDEGDHP